MKNFMIERESIPVDPYKEVQLKLDVAKGDPELGEDPEKYYANTPDGRRGVSVCRIDDHRDLVRLSYVPGIDLTPFAITLRRPQTIPSLKDYGLEDSP